MNYPRITVVTPSFNQSNYLEQTIRSVLDQRYPNLEYIIIDGGSTDGSVEIINKYADKLHFWCSERDNGLYFGIQKGFEKSNGDIMCWINSDDILHPRSLFTIAEVFSKFKDVEWLQGIPSVIDETGKIVYVKNFRKWSKYAFWSEEKDHIQQESTFWRRSLWLKAGGRLDTSMKLAGDFELWLRFFDHAKLYCITTVLGAFRMRSKDQLSLERMSEYTAEAKAILQKHNAGLSSAETMRLNKINKYRNSKVKFPFIRKNTAANYESLFEYPLSISYNREKNSFELVRL